MNKMKKIAGVCLAGMITMLMTVPAFAGQWEWDGYGGWWYQRSDGSIPAGQWELIDNVWYYFWPDEYMAANVELPDGNWVDENGAWLPNGRPSGYQNVRFSDVTNKVYLNRNNGTTMTIGQWSDDGTIYVAFHTDDGYDAWYGTCSRIYTFSETGTFLDFRGTPTWEGETLGICLYGYESLDYPGIVFFGKDNELIQGDYEYYYSVENSN